MVVSVWRATGLFGASRTGSQGLTLPSQQRGVVRVEYLWMRQGPHRVHLFCPLAGGLVMVERQLGKWDSQVSTNQGVFTLT